jgi:hypothetical protein
MTLLRERLPEPQGYFESQDLELVGRGAWRTTRCAFHGGSDSMRVNLRSGGFCCMAGCGARGGDVLAYHMAAHGLGFVEAAKELGAWQDDPASAHAGTQRRRPFGLPAREALAQQCHGCLLEVITRTGMLWVSPRGVRGERPRL